MVAQLVIYLIIFLGGGISGIYFNSFNKLPKKVVKKDRCSSKYLRNKIKLSTNLVLFLKKNKSTSNYIKQIEKKSDEISDRIRNLEIKNIDLLVLEKNIFQKTSNIVNFQEEEYIKILKIEDRIKEMDNYYCAIIQENNKHLSEIIGIQQVAHEQILQMEKNIDDRIHETARVLKIAQGNIGEQMGKIDVKIEKIEKQLSKIKRNQDNFSWNSGKPSYSPGKKSFYTEEDK